ncbi:hypothetical protein BGZ49_009099 [Haplosporangium sp. Z 27]|nr:hypothetical protein BGZ49_009099 [Haplosporangium sp. Z 27]
MIFNHPSAYIFSNLRPLCSNQSRKTPAPHVGASEGPIWSPYLKSSGLVSSRSIDHLNKSSIVNPIEEKSRTTVAIPRTRSRNFYHASSEQAPSTFSSTSRRTSLSMSSSAYFSLSVPSEDEEEQTMMRDQAGWETEGRTRARALVNEPPSPAPRFAKIKAAFALRRRE